MSEALNAFTYSKLLTKSGMALDPTVSLPGTLNAAIALAVIAGIPADEYRAIVDKSIDVAYAAFQKETSNG